MASPIESRADSGTISERVGWECIVDSISKTVPLKCIYEAISATSSGISAPIPVAPKIFLDFSSVITFKNPSGSSIANAIPLAT